jgi:thiol-disulfide isomerase/thioredoxin
MNLLRRSFLALTIAATTVLSTAAFAVDAPDDRAPVSDFSLDDLDGDEVSRSDFDGKVVVISFWATWCGPCLQELPHMQTIADEHPDDVVVLAITTDGPDTMAEVRNIVRRNRWTMPILLDQDGSVMSQLNPRGTQPFTMFIDRSGNLAASHEGFSSGDEIGHAETVATLITE